MGDERLGAVEDDTKDPPPTSDQADGAAEEATATGEGMKEQPTADGD